MADRSSRIKLFYFGDYEGLRRVQGNTQSGVSVPTLAERNSGYTNLADLITGQGTSSRADALGRQIPLGTILDPATTRAVAAGALDPVSGLAKPPATPSMFAIPSARVQLRLSQLHSRRLRTESTSCRPVGSERHQALESLPTADQLAASVQTLHRAPLSMSIATPLTFESTTTSAKKTRYSPALAR